MNSPPRKMLNNASKMDWERKLKECLKATYPRIPQGYTYPPWGENLCKIKIGWPAEEEKPIPVNNNMKKRRLNAKAYRPQNNNNASGNGNGKKLMFGGRTTKRRKSNRSTRRR
jgi:hypothetical protein